LTLSCCISLRSWTSWNESSSIVDQLDRSSWMEHSFLLSGTPQFETWQKAKTLSINFAVGIPRTRPSRVLITNGPTKADFRDGYHYQHGEYFTAYPFDPNRPTNSVSRNIASGIFQHAVIVLPDGTEQLLVGHFPPTKEITLFE